MIFCSFNASGLIFKNLICVLDKSLLSLIFSKSIFCCLWHARRSAKNRWRLYTERTYIVWTSHRKRCTSILTQDRTGVIYHSAHIISNLVSHFKYAVIVILVSSVTLIKTVIGKTEFTVFMKNNTSEVFFDFEFQAWFYDLWLELLVPTQFLKVADSWFVFEETCSPR